MIKEQVVKAYHFAQKKHHGQKRSFVGLPYFTHPKFVARLIEDLTNNETMVCAAFLHDVLEDTATTEIELDQAFDSEVCCIVKELTNNKTDSRKVGKTKYLSEKMVRMSEDALTVKLADRYHNVLFLESDGVPVMFIKRYTIETNDILRTLIEKRDSLNRIQRALILRILSVLMFIQIRYKLEMEIPLVCL
jgi:(p)ppGpp synthase/HD superfamily hydrolase